MGKKNGIPNKLQDDCVRKKFLDTFGKSIEDFEAFKRATEHLEKSTRASASRSLAGYFIYLGENPDQVIANRQKDVYSVDATENERYERKTKAYAKTLKTQGIAGFTISARLGRVQGFFSNNGKRLSLDLGNLKISKARKNKKHSATNEEVRHLVTVADSARDALIITLMNHHGAAPVDVAALCGGDYPAKVWTYFERSRSKTGEVWRGVTTPDTINCLEAYLAVRGPVEIGEPIFLSREGNPLDNQSVSEIVSEVIKKAGYDSIDGFRPYSLRDAFEDALVDANINHKVKEALMGHTSSIQHQYGSDDKMAVRMVEAMKRAYKFLSLKEQPAHLDEDVALKMQRVDELEKKVEGQNKVIDDLAQKRREQDLELEAIKAKMQRLEGAKPVLEALLKRVEELEIKIKRS